MEGRDYLRPIAILRRLKRCPFCGDNAIAAPFYNDTDDLIYMILCLNRDCNAVVQFNGADTEEMVRRWNIRIPDTNESLTNE